MIRLHNITLTYTRISWIPSKSSNYCQIDNSSWLSKRKGLRKRKHWNRLNVENHCVNYLDPWLLFKLVIYCGAFFFCTLSTGYWPLGVVWCNVYVTSDVLACSCSILHMVSISWGRYLGIRNPLKTRHAYATKRVVGIKIAVVWVLSFTVSTPVTLLGKMHFSTYRYPTSYVPNTYERTLIYNEFVDT